MAFFPHHHSGSDANLPRLLSPSVFRVRADLSTLSTRVAEPATA